MRDRRRGQEIQGERESPCGREPGGGAERAGVLWTRSSAPLVAGKHVSEFAATLAQAAKRPGAGAPGVSLDSSPRWTGPRLSPRPTPGQQPGCSPAPTLCLCPMSPAPRAPGEVTASIPRRPRPSRASATPLLWSRLRSPGCKAHPCHVASGGLRLTHWSLQLCSPTGFKWTRGPDPWAGEGPLRSWTDACSQGMV